jgi:o-succinylbenzoate synthase
VSAVPAPFERVAAHRVSVPFRNPFETAGGVLTARNSWIFRLLDRDGYQGFGEIVLDPAATRADENRLHEAVLEAVVELAAGRVPGRDLTAGAGAANRALLAGLHEAIEGLRAAASGLRTPGEAARPNGRPSIAVNATIDIARGSTAVDAAARAVGDGFSCLKLKVGREASSDLATRVAAVRAAVGDSVRLRLDANSSWTYDMAVERFAALAPLDIEYVEQPLAADDLQGHVALRRNHAVPIALDESVGSEEAATAILQAGAADILVIKPARVGGPGAVRAIAARAAAAGVPIVVSTFFETGIGTDAAIRAAATLPLVGRERAHGLATAGILVHDLLEVPVTVVDGRIAVPKRLAVDEDALRRFTVETVGSDS